MKSWHSLDHFWNSNEAVSELNRIDLLQLVVKLVGEQLRAIYMFLIAGRLWINLTVLSNGNFFIRDNCPLQWQMLLLEWHWLDLVGSLPDSSLLLVVMRSMGEFDELFIGFNINFDIWLRDWNILEVKTGLLLGFGAWKCWKHRSKSGWWLSVGKTEFWKILKYILLLWGCLVGDSLNVSHLAPTCRRGACGWGCRIATLHHSPAPRWGRGW